MILLWKRLDCLMRFLRKIKRRFVDKKYAIELPDEDVAFMLQMGWAEQVFGAYLMTDRGYAELSAFLEAIKKEQK